MSVNNRAAFAVAARPRQSSRSGAVAAIALTMAVAAHSPQFSLPLSGPEPFDPKAPSDAVGYRSTIAPYRSRRPVEPAPWRGRNEQVKPPVKK